MGANIKDTRGNNKAKHDTIGEIKNMKGEKPMEIKPCCDTMRHLITCDNVVIDNNELSTKPRVVFSKPPYWLLDYCPTCGTKIEIITKGENK